MRLNLIVAALAVVTCLSSASLAVGGPLNGGPCVPNPCANGGTCMEANGGFDCLCPPGFTGTTCEIPPPVPAVSEWGIASLGLLLLAGLTIKFRGALPKPA